MGPGLCLRPALPLIGITLFREAYVPGYCLGVDLIHFGLSFSGFDSFWFELFQLFEFWAF